MLDGNLWRGFPLALLLSSLLAAGAGARELELGGRLEGFPFSSAYSVAASSDGRDLYASGSRSYNVLATPGLAWLRRDPATGRLEFKRNYLSTGGQPAVFGSVLGAGERYLYVLRAAELTSFSRNADGALDFAFGIALPATFRPQAVHLLPSGEILAHGLAGNRIYGTSPNGELTLRQILDAAPLYRDLVALDDQTLISGSAVLERQNGVWSWQPLTSITSAIGFAGGLLGRADRRYFYSFQSSGTFPHIGYYVVTLELAGGSLIEAARSELDLDWETERTAAAINPESGDLYVASFSTNGFDHGRIEHLRAISGGRSFAGGELLYDISGEGSRKTAKDSLAFSLDGRHLYATFDHQPIALLEVDPALGTLTHRPLAAGLHSRFERPFGVVAGATGEAFLLTPHAVLRVLLGGGASPLLVSSLGIESWTSAYRPLRGLALVPGGGLGVLATDRDLVMVERDPAGGGLQALPATRVEIGGGIGLPAISHDGRFVYVPGENTVLVYRLERGGAPKLTLLQNLAGLSGQVLLSPDGFRMALLRENGRPTLLERSSATGLLSLADPQLPAGIGNVFGAAFGGDDRMLHLFRSGGEFGPRIELLARQPDGSWTLVSAYGLAESHPASRLLDAGGHSVVTLGEMGLELYGLLNFHPDFDLALIDQRGRDQLGGAGAPLGNALSDYPPRAIELLPGENELAMVHRDTGNLQLFRRGCSGLSYASPCLSEKRFRVEVVWRDAEGLAWPAQVSPYGSDDAQVFSFFDRENWELMVKVLDGCAINDRFWVYAAASTDVGFEIRVTDTWTGARKLFASPAGAPAPAITDSAAFATCGAFSPGWNPPARERAPLAEVQELRLGGRFVATVGWTNHQGQSGRATGLAQLAPGARSGLFYFFDRNNWEMQLKVLDGCAINGHYWVLGAATTDVGYVVDIEDRQIGRVRSYGNPVGRASPAIIDIEAFPCD